MGGSTFFLTVLGRETRPLSMLGWHRAVEVTFSAPGLLLFALLCLRQDLAVESRLALNFAILLQSP